MSESHTVESLADDLLQQADKQSIEIGEIVEIFGNRSFGSALTILGLLAIVPPIGMIPGLPATVGLIIILFTAQIIIGRDHIWLPGFIEKRSVSHEKIEKMVQKARPWLKRVDGLVTPRFTWILDDTGRVVAAIIVSLLSLAMIPLEIIPFAVALPGIAIICFGLAFLSRDGAFAVAGGLFTVITLGTLFRYVF